MQEGPQGREPAAHPSGQSFYLEVTHCELLRAGSNESRVRWIPLLPHPFFVAYRLQGEPQPVSASKRIGSLEDRLEQRAAPRLPVAVPAVIRVGDEEHSASLLNLSPSGAMIETSARLVRQATVTLRCGTVEVSAIVIWSKGEHVGLRFEVSLSDGQVAEQVSRSTAIAARRDRQGGRLIP